MARWEEESLRFPVHESTKMTLGVSKPNPRKHSPVEITPAKLITKTLAGRRLQGKYLTRMRRLIVTEIMRKLAIGNRLPPPMSPTTTKSEANFTWLSQH
jgi:hypothetical protein